MIKIEEELEVKEKEPLYLSTLTNKTIKEISGVISKENVNEKYQQDKLSILTIYPIHYFGLNGTLDQIKYLIKCGGDQNALTNDGRNLLYRLLEQSELMTDRIEYLLENGGKINLLHRTTLQSALHLLCSHPQITFDLLELCLEKEGFLLQQNRQGRTCFSLLCSNPNVDSDLLDLCFQKCASLNTIEDRQHKTAFHYLCQNERCTRTKFMKVMIKNKCDVNSQDNNGKTPLYYLCQNPYMKWSRIKEAIKGGADFKIKDNNNTTPFHNLCKNPRFKPKLLIELNSLVKKTDLPLNVVNRFNMTPLLTLCQSYFINKQMLEMLIMMGSKVDKIVLNETKEDENTLEEQEKNKTEKNETKKNEKNKKSKKKKEQKETKQKKNKKKKNIIPLYPLNLVCLNPWCNLEIIQLLLTAGANPNSQDHQGDTPLTCLCHRNEIDLDIVVELINNGADVNHTNERFKGGLMLDLIKRMKKVSLTFIKFFVETAKIDLSLENSEGQTVLHYLCKSKKGIDYNIVQYLIKNGADINYESTKASDNRTPFFLACENPKIGWDDLKKLITKFHGDLLFVDSSSRKNCFLAYCSRTTNIELKAIKYLSKKKLIKDINVTDKNGLSALHHICKANTVDLSVYKYVLGKLNADINLKDHTKKTPLHYLCFSRHIDPKILEFLLSQKIKDINCVDYRKNSALLLLLGNYYGLNFQNVELLINAGSNVNLKNLDKMNGMHCACRNPGVTIDTLELLIQKNVKYWEFDTYGRNPFLCALSYLPRISLIKYLLEFTKNINHLDSTGRNCIHYVIQSVQRNNTKRGIQRILQILEFLIENGAETSIKGKNNQMPKDISANERLIKKLLLFNPSYANDFQNLFKYKQFTNETINNIPIHKSILFARTKISDIGKIKDLLKSFDTKEIKIFLKWAYGYNILSNKNHYQMIKPIFKQLGIENPEKHHFKKDLINYYDSSEKDFILLVKKKKIKVHKIFLMARSKLFRDMFENTQTTEKAIHDYSDKPYGTIKLFINFLYQDHLKMKQLNKKIVEDLHEMIEYYQLNKKSKLKYYLSKYIENIKK
ncbi:ankyrin repeat-containing protein [Anaeramoeba flamelloides]|uniref:Ankyrin repeat-containing protein n=1 Tax=Anaeramoeba flamelloides TaxID=1746091 RepID=A0AAV7Z422_9EUKA|nr:ankyrin repeat-containing protein [Anaeramoeba flamelloides]